MSLRSPPYLIPALIAIITLGGCRDLPTALPEATEAPRGPVEPTVAASDRASLRAELTDITDRVIPAIGDGISPLKSALAELDGVLAGGQVSAIRSARLEAGRILEKTAEQVGKEFDAEIDAIRLVLTRLDEVLESGAQ